MRSNVTDRRGEAEISDSDETKRADGAKETRRPLTEARFNAECASGPKENGGAWWKEGQASKFVVPDGVAMRD